MVACPPLLCRSRLLALMVGVSVSAISSGCASLGSEKKDLDLAEGGAADFHQVKAVASSGSVSYSFDTLKNQGQWLACKIQGAHGAMVVMHTDRAGYDKDKFCQGWIAQTFLGLGYDVLAINRPGFGESSGSEDYIGRESLTELAATIPAGAKAAGLAPLVGAWGYETGATAAALAAKQQKGLKFLLLGGGIYDYEETMRTTSDAALKANIAVLKKSTGSDKAIEERSVAYDISGLPPVISLYTGANDTVAPVSQAKTFADSLTSSGNYKVTFRLLPDMGHDLPWVYHRHLIEAMVKELTAPTPAAH